MSHSTRLSNVFNHLSPQIQINNTNTNTNTYKYSVNPDGLLSEEQRKFYEINGKIYIKNIKYNEYTS
jgi:hypothetical protein